jgi:hypothetical protein
LGTKKGPQTLAPETTIIAHIYILQVFYSEQFSSIIYLCEKKDIL